MNPRLRRLVLLIVTLLALGVASAENRKPGKAKKHPAAAAEPAVPVQAPAAAPTVPGASPGVPAAANAQSPDGANAETGGQDAGGRDAQGHGHGHHHAFDPRGVHADAFGDRIDLTSTWLFRRGSGPEYTSPTYDDSDWQTIDTGRPLVTQGLLNLNEVWYRSHVTLIPGSHSLALTVAEFGGSYRVYVNGQELGGHGRMKGRGEYLIARSATFEIPDALATTGQLVIVIHAFVGTVDRISFTLQDGIARHSSVYLGPSQALTREQVSYFRNAREVDGYILVLWFVLGVLATGLALIVRRDTSYPALAATAFAFLIAHLLIDYSASHYFSRTMWLTWPITVFLLVSQLAPLEFVRIIAGRRHGVWIRIVEGLAVFSAILLLPAALDLISFFFYSVMVSVSQVVVGATILAYIVSGARRRKLDSLVLAGTLLLVLFYIGLWYLLGVVDSEIAWVNTVFQAITNGIHPAEILYLAEVVGLLAVLIVRTLHIVRERASIATEIEAARTMQQLLLSRSGQTTPGFQVETVYLPAGEVGGDFFLILPNADGSLTAVLGDVSGKGLRAAMRVSMILGVLRREPGRDPAVILTALNEALYDGGESGFTTACCLRLFAGGRFTIANAGQISPYLVDPAPAAPCAEPSSQAAGDAGLPWVTVPPPPGSAPPPPASPARPAAGTPLPFPTPTFGSQPFGAAPSPCGVEFPTPPALPLGLASGVAFEEVSGTLPTGHRLVLVSDGVPEARSHRGELYGFDRLSHLTTLPADLIAEIARSFGQTDDITVLSITRLGVAAKATPGQGAAVQGGGGGAAPPPPARPAAPPPIS